MRRRKIGRSLLISILLFAFLLGLAITAIGYRFYFDGVIDDTNKYAESAINYIIKDINPDKMREAIESKERTFEIINVEETCDKIKQTHDVEYVYIIVPLNLEEKDNMQYVLTGEPLEDRQSGFIINNGQLSGDDYTPDIVSKYFEAMDKGGELTFFTNTTKFGYMYTGMKAIVDNNGKSIAIVAIDINVDSLKTALYTYIIVVIISAFVITCVFISIIYSWLYRRIVKPLKSIEKSANDFVELSHKGVAIEELNYTKPNIKTRDEIERLSDSVCTMSNDLKKYMINVVKVEGEKNRIAGELNVATHIQSSMLPCIFPAFPNDNRFEIYATMNPAKEVGGDFYDFFMVDEKHIAIIVADVSGKGVPAALFMVIGKTLIKDHTTSDKDLGQVFKEVNELLCESNSEGLFITAFEAVINLENGDVKYVNAGHEMPYIYRKDKKWSAFEMKAAFVLAGMEGMKYTAGEFKLNHGDRIFQYTDGVTEATNANNELYGMERLNKILNNNINSDSEKLLKAIKEDIDKFVGDAPQFDDITMLGFEYK